MKTPKSAQYLNKLTFVNIKGFIATRCYRKDNLNSFEVVRIFFPVIKDVCQITIPMLKSSSGRTARIFPMFDLMRIINSTTYHNSDSLYIPGSS
jgi:hypothetical protein